VMNRHERRRNAAKQRHNKFVNEYVHHLPIGGGGQRKTRSGLNARWGRPCRSKSERPLTVEH
jgi:hypothetical protein